MGKLWLIMVVVVGVMVGVPTLGNAKNCKKGQPCGNSCISWDKTCRVGSSGASTPSPSHRNLPAVSDPTPTERILEVQQRRCIRVKDGDTIVLDGGETVRLIGINTPETKDPRKPVEYFGKEASAFTKRMAEGKTVTLAFDQANAATGFKDKYQRTLAYVFLEDGRLLNAEILRQGYGQVESRFPFAKREEFRGLERKAREQQRGLWGKP